MALTDEFGNEVMSEDGELTPLGEAKIRDGLEVLAEAAGRSARHAGWHEKERSFLEELFLWNSEISEAGEEYRNHHGYAEQYEGEGGKPEGIPSEVGDLLIRAADSAWRRGIPWADGVISKLRFNRTRGYRHGGKKA